MSFPTRLLLQVSAVGVVLGSASLLGGCAGGPSSGSTPNPACTAYVNVGPSVGTANHAALLPANQVAFVVDSGETCSNGATPAMVARLYPAWDNPDPIDIQISSAQDNTNGTAVCKGPTSGAVTLTATGTNGTTPYTKTVQLTCQ